MLDESSLPKRMINGQKLMAWAEKEKLTISGLSDDRRKALVAPRGEVPYGYPGPDWKVLPDEVFDE